MSEGADRIADIEMALVYLHAPSRDTDANKQCKEAWLRVRERAEKCDDRSKTEGA